MNKNTGVYILLLVTSLSASYYTENPIYKLGIFLVTYCLLFGWIEYLDIFPGWNIWSQTERTSECYDWFHHYLRKDYGLVNGKTIYDYTENIYHNDYKASAEKSLLNKYDLIFKSLHLSKGKKLLDCGCGTGSWMSFCKERGVDVVGLTLSKEQRQVVEKKGMTAYVQDYRVLNPSFIQQFDAISLLGSAEHVIVISSFYTLEKDAYRDFDSLFKVLRQYLKPQGKMLMTLLVQGIPESQRSSFYDRLQTYIILRHYGGYYPKIQVVQKAITDNGFQIESIEDYTKDYHWISVAEPDHFGHWWIRWDEDPLDKITYFFKGLLTDPFLIHHWLYYGLDSWMWQFYGYQTTPLTDDQVKQSVANLKYFVFSVPDTQTAKT